ncbi:MAG: peptidase M48 [Caulobacterales bacterium 68-7]|nr:MAG: peptidase M48 [Caulobacterales bacterium 68-7]
MTARFQTSAPGRTVPRSRRRAGVALAALALACGLAAPVAHAQDGMSLIRDTEIEEILSKDAAPLMKAAGFDPQNVRVMLIGSKDLNAFAAPGQVGVFTGLILESKTPNELKGVLAHEVGHLAGGHSFRSGDMQRAGLVPMILTMGLGALAAMAGSTDGAAVLLGNAGFFGTLGALGYSREQESRADQAGATLLEATGQSGKGLADFFDNFRYQEVFDQSRRFSYFRSHPLSSDRIDRLRSRVEALPHYSAVDTPDELAEHAIMKAKLDGFINPGQSLIKYKETDTSFPARYARAIAYYQTKEPDRAIKLTDALIADQPNNPYLYELKGQILFEFNRAKEAEPAQRRSVELKPDAPLLRVNLGQTLINQGDKAKTLEGIDILKQAVVKDTDNVDGWRLLAQAYDSLGMDGDARLATAEQYFALGAKREARTFAMRAREMLAKDSPGWRRATDIVLVSQPTDQDLRDMARRGVTGD